MQMISDQNPDQAGDALTPTQTAVPTRLYAVFGAMLLVLVIMTIVSYRAVSEMSSASEWNAHTYEAHRAVKGISNGLYAMQVASRAYVLTGESPFYQSWESGKKDISKNFQLALGLTTTDRDQQGRLANFKEYFGQWMGLYNKVLLARRTQGTSAALAVSRGQEDERNSILNRMKSELTDMVKAEEAALAAHSQSQSAWAGRTRIMLIFYGILTIALTSLLSLSLVRSNRLLVTTNEGLSKEIMERKRAEREIRELHDYSEQILSSTTEGIIGLNPRGRITFANPAAAKMIAWDLQQVIGKAVDSVLQRDMPDATLSPTRDNLLNASLRDGRVHSVPDGIFTRKDGSRFSVEYTITPLRDETVEVKEGESNVTGAVITFRDITVRKRTEMSLLRLASIVESSKDAILGHNFDGRIVSWNTAAVKLYGYSPREVEGCSMSILFPPDRSEEVIYLIERIKNGERVEPYQTVIQTRDGDPVEVALTLYPVKDSNGNIMGATSNARRIIKRRTEEQLPVYMTELRLGNETDNAESNAHPAGATAVGADGA